MSFLSSINPQFGDPEPSPSLDGVWLPKTAWDAFNHIIDEIDTRALKRGGSGGSSSNGYLTSIKTPSGNITVRVSGDPEGTARVTVAMPNVEPWEWTGPTIGRMIPDSMLNRLADDSEAIAEAEADGWDDDSDYGYADRNFVGIETWEDGPAMAVILANQNLPADWIIVKVVNFTEVTLQQQIAWLAENCEDEFKRIGWRAGCSTKIAIAFSNGDDAALYRLKWR
jgi:hypothetical protein